MTVQYAIFSLPLYSGSPEEEELNRFLRGHRVIQTRKKLMESGAGTSWVFLVEYMEDQKSGASGRPQQSQQRVDYKEILLPEDFQLYSKMRELRKTVAESQGIPVYTVFSNDQLAEMARSRPANRADLQKLAGIGEGKADRYGAAFLELVAGFTHAAGAAGAAGGQPF